MLQQVPWALSAFSAYHDDCIARCSSSASQIQACNSLVGLILNVPRYSVMCRKGTG